jgi:CRP/FNR family cyclic AMP-dependent transcriptional regulator
MADWDPKLERLTSSPTFAKLGHRKLKTLAPFIDDVDVAAGTTLMKEGSHPHDLAVLVTGTAEIFVGGEKVNEVGPGAILGEMALVNHANRSATVVTTSAAHLILISGDAFSDLMEHHPDIAEDIRSLAAERAAHNEGTVT